MNLSEPRKGASHHDGRATEQIAHEAANFIRQEAGPESLITVTRAVLTSRGDRATVFVSVFPEEKTQSALFFLELNRQGFSEYLKMHTRLNPLPRINFMPDNGEKGRQRLDELGKAV